MKITGTFLCGTEVDIPANNWSEKEWRREFRIMREIGIDTVILIHSGFLKLPTFPSEVLKKHVKGLRPCYADLPALFLELAEENNMSFYPGTYVGAMWGYTAENCDLIKPRELEINKEFIDEIWDRYGKSKAFAGWYNSFELNTEWSCCTDTVREISRHAKKISGDLPVLLSPYYIPISHYKRKNKPFPEGVIDEESNLKYHAKCWDKMLGELEGAVDMIAFQDGVECEMDAFLKTNSELFQKHRIKQWSNVETFAHNTAIRFPPADWNELRWKLETSAAEGHIEKLISFELPHFMSPNSFWPSGRCLFERYCEYIGKY